MRPVFGTFGIYRWLLASLVIITHLGPADYKYCGVYAVFAFFTLSGYVVTYILRTHYLEMRHGRAKFYLNRALRVYPLYWTALLFSFLIIRRHPGIAHTLNSFMNLPDDSTGWIANMFALGLVSPLGTLSTHMLITVAWSLGVEIVWWLLIPWLCTHGRLIRMTLRAAIIYTALVAVSIFVFKQDSSNLRYYSPLAGLLPFAIGMLIFHCKSAGLQPMRRSIGTAVAIALLTLLCFADDLFAHPLIEGTYGFVLVSGFFIYFLSGIAAHTLPAWLRRLDTFLGSLSYPVFLLHMPGAVLLRAVCPGLAYDSWGFYAAGLLLANMLALVLHYCVEAPVEILRRRVRA